MFGKLVLNAFSTQYFQLTVGLLGHNPVVSWGRSAFKVVFSLDHVACWYPVLCMFWRQLSGIRHTVCNLRSNLFKGFCLGIRVQEVIGPSFLLLENILG